ncbi:MAG TPA: G1 family glutamic endopeptidase [Bryobacteraceae bacterium]|nr:G1 family glutamic endopeptidase [Bryobacteraceae bacterium]
MKLTRIEVCRLARIASSALVIAGGLAQAQDAMIPAPHQHRPISVRRVHDYQTSVDSTNWSGYAVTGAASSVTLAAGSWIVPAATCPAGTGRRRAPAEYASFWVGIDGWNSNSVEQLGTDSDCSNGIPSYYAWYEFYPEPSYYANCTARQQRLGQCTGSGNLTSLHPGDVMSASVSYNSNGSFTLAITDETSRASFSVVVTPNAQTGTPQRSSAEWIAEAPSSSSGILPLADFGTVKLGDDSTGVPMTCWATVGGLGPYPIASFGSNNVWMSTMVTNSDVVKALPSSLSPDGSSFSVAWKSAGP